MGYTSESIMIKVCNVDSDRYAKIFFYKYIHIKNKLFKCFLNHCYKVFKCCFNIAILYTFNIHNNIRL